MPDTSAIDFADNLRRSTLEVLWRQWRTLGATATGSAPTRTTIDPEALILMSLWMMDHERRLADIVWSWVERHSALVSIQRLGNLRTDLPLIVSQRLAALAEDRVERAKDLRWRSLRKGEAALLGERSDKVRAAEPRDMSWATLLLQLRMGMGVGAKADVLAFTLGLNPHTPEWASVSTIADAVGYTPAAVRRAADDLARARFIHALNTGESEQGTRMFRGNPEAWGVLLRIDPVIHGWGYWRERYRFVIDVLSWYDRELERPTTPYARDVAAREILTRHRTALRRDRIVDPFESAGQVPTLADLTSASNALTTFWISHG